MRARLSCIFFLAFSVAARAQVKNDLFVSDKDQLTSIPLVAGNKIASIYVDSNDAKVVTIAANAFVNDIKLVSGSLMKITNSLDESGDVVIAGTIGHSKEIDRLVSDKELDVSPIQNGWERFMIRVLHHAKRKILIIAGSDYRGTAYGLFELSRVAGVSPWVWWADALPSKKEQLYISGSYISKEPSVKYRGIFINDEDWGLQPWAAKTFEPETGDIGPKTYAKVFELLLRLRANLIWPAMHPSTKAFFHYPGNAEVAADYAIIIGTSHAEPMLRNNVDEWNEKTLGEFNFLNNHDAIYKYWEDRVKETKKVNAFYTLGIRGVHDSKMLGANTLQEQKDLLDKVVKVQRQLLTRYINPDIEKIPQAFIPYKEVQDIYDYGFDVPDDVTLIWCDDNYGYIRHFPNEKERARKGGNGVYYHISYWGRPHDYLWLATTHPALVYTQMRMAYDKGAKEMWVVNVGDIKPAEYLTELFMDMAWNIESIDNNKKGLEMHLHTWLAREFGSSNANDLLTVMNEYYRLAYIRKPEFMGATRTEESDPKYKIVTDLPWSEERIHLRLKEYALAEQKVLQISKRLPVQKQDSWIQLIEYPVRGASAMNRKLLYAELARHGKSGWKQSDAAYDTIVALTKRYNDLNNGKWKYMMDFKPRELAVFDKAIHTKSDQPLVQPEKALFVFNANEYKTFIGRKPISYGLGYQRGAVSLAKSSSIQFLLTFKQKDSIEIIVALAPDHPVQGKEIRYAIQLDKEPAQIIDYATHGRSEEWKENVLTNQAIRTTHRFLNRPGKHILKITALDDGVIVDQVKVFAN